MAPFPKDLTIHSDNKAQAVGAELEKWAIGKLKKQGFDIGDVQSTFTSYYEKAPSDPNESFVDVAVKTTTGSITVKLFCDDISCKPFYSHDLLLPSGGSNAGGYVLGGLLLAGASIAALAQQYYIAAPLGALGLMALPSCDPFEKDYSCTYIDCGDHGKCYSDGSLDRCDCDEGYTFVNYTCLPISRALISKNKNSEPANADCSLPRTSEDGTSIIFLSSATNLVPNDTSTKKKLFLMDLNNKTTEKINPAVDGDIKDADISGDGKFIAYEVNADIYLYDRLSKTHTLISDFPEKNSWSSHPRFAKGTNIISFTASRDSGSQVYFYYIDSNKLSQITQPFCVYAGLPWAEDLEYLSEELQYLRVDNVFGCHNYVKLDEEEKRVIETSYSFYYYEFTNQSVDAEGEVVTYVARGAPPEGTPLQDIVAYAISDDRLRLLTPFSNGWSFFPIISPNGNNVAFYSEATSFNNKSYGTIDNTRIYVLNNCYSPYDPNARAIIETSANVTSDELSMNSIFITYVDGNGIKFADYFDATTKTIVGYPYDSPDHINSSQPFITNDSQVFYASDLGIPEEGIFGDINAMQIYMSELP